MSPSAVHSAMTLAIGLAVGMTWLRLFWSGIPLMPAPVLLAPAAVGVLGLGHWFAYDFSLGHWAGDFALGQSLFNLGVTAALFYRRAQIRRAAAS